MIREARSDITIRNVHTVAGNGYLREPIGADRIHRGTAELGALFSGWFSSGATSNWCKGFKAIPAFYQSSPAASIAIARQSQALAFSRGTSYNIISTFAFRIFLQIRKGELT